MDDGKPSRSDSVITGSPDEQVYGVNNGSNGHHYKLAKATASDDALYRTRGISYYILISFFLIFL